MRALDLNVATLCAALLAAACGGRVNLGGTADPAAQTSGDGIDDLKKDPYYVPSQVVTPLDPGKVLDTLAVFGDYLYVTVINSGQDGLYRCRKDACTLQRVSGVTDFLQTFDVQEQRLVVLGGTDTSWVGSYALPDVTDKQVVIDQLPPSGGANPLFHRGYAFWSIPVDQSMYRCSLPACSGGPGKVGVVANGGGARAEGDLLFLLNFGKIYRSAKLGDGPVEHLQPDATLSSAPAEADGSDAIQSYAGAIQTSAGMLYATLSDGPEGCVSDPATDKLESCQTTFARWPAAGGAREDLFATPDRVGAFYVFGSELVWLAQPSGVGSVATLSTCVIEACSATLRHVGQALYGLRGIAADAERLYWLESARRDASQFSAWEVAIRSVPLLAAP